MLRWVSLQIQSRTTNHEPLSRHISALLPNQLNPRIEYETRQGEVVYINYDSNIEMTEKVQMREFWLQTRRI